MTEIVSKIEQKSSKVVKELPMRFFERIETDWSDKTEFDVVNKIKQIAMEMYENINTMDGVKIVFPDSWALIRASNTSPILRLSIEARDLKRLDEVKKEKTKLIKRVDTKC